MQVPTYTYRAADGIFRGAALQEAVLVVRAVHDSAAAGRALARNEALRQAQYRRPVAHVILNTIATVGTQKVYQERLVFIAANRTCLWLGIVDDL